MYKIKKLYTPECESIQGEDYTKVQMITVPGQSYGINDILYKFEHGVMPSINLSKNQKYDFEQNKAGSVPDVSFDTIPESRRPGYDLGDYTNSYYSAIRDTLIAAADIKPLSQNPNDQTNNNGSEADE